MGEDMLHDYENIDEAIGEGYGIIGTLVNACLLEWCRENYLKMHDVIRDMALWITSKPGSANGNFLVRARVGLIKVPEVNKWENIKRMSLIDNKIEKLIGAPRCPHLLTLFLRNNGLQMIDDCFFEHMHSLKVLDLFGNPNLRKLPSGISNLVSLQYLNLFDTGVKMFTIQLINLANLKCLFMEQEKEYCSASTEVLQSISKLQVLRMVKRKSLSRNHDDDDDDDDEWEDNSGSGLVADLKYLKNLIQLRMAVENSSTLESFFRLFQLQSCVVHIDIKHFRGVRFIDIESMGYLRGLSITDCESLEEIDVDGTWGAIETEASSNLCYQMPKESRFYNLRSVHISSCYQLRDATWLVYAQFLEVLVIYRCDKMEEVICSEKLDRAQEMVKDLLPFANLQRLDISYLNNLTSIYRTALPFERLQEININGCPKLKKLPLNYHSANVSLRRIYGQQEWWSQLEWEDETAQDVFSLYFFSYETY